MTAVRNTKEAPWAVGSKIIWYTLWFLDIGKLLNPSWLNSFLVGLWLLTGLMCLVVNLCYCYGHSHCIVGWQWCWFFRIVFRNMTSNKFKWLNYIVQVAIGMTRTSDTFLDPRHFALPLDACFYSAQKSTQFSWIENVMSEKVHGQIQMEQNQVSQYMKQAGNAVVDPVLPLHPHIWQQWLRSLLNIP